VQKVEANAHDGNQVRPLSGIREPFA
jgi:hypothetical protein